MKESGDRFHIIVNADPVITFDEVKRLINLFEKLNFKNRQKVIVYAEDILTSQRTRQGKK